MSEREPVVKSTSGVRSNPFAGLDTRREALQAALAVAQVNASVSCEGTDSKRVLADARAIEAFLAGGESE